jgi:hypothetical protein
MSFKADLGLAVVLDICGPQAETERLIDAEAPRQR